MGIQDGSIREALSIPFMQTARYVCTYEDEVTDYEKEVIDGVLDYASLKNYMPKHADSVKNTYKNDDSKLPEYFKVWFEMFLKHPGCYIEAFLNKIGGYIAPVYVGFSAPIGYDINDYLVEKGISHIFGDNVFIYIAANIEQAFMELPLLRYFCMAGMYTWILLICIILLLRKRIYKGIILFVPEIMNLLVCLASPTWHFRYSLPTVAAMPLIIGWTYYLISEEQKKSLNGDSEHKEKLENVGGFIEN